MMDLNKLYYTINSISGMSQHDFDLSLKYWRHIKYQKGEFFNEYKNVCKHIGFIMNGVFRVYKITDNDAIEKNMLFFTENQFITSYKSFFSQLSCDYFTESMTASEILYIHYDHLQELFKSSPAWERFGRIFAELALNAVMENIEGFLFKTAEDRYQELLDHHPMIIQSVPLYHIASYLGIGGPSLSRIRKRMLNKSREKIEH